MPIFNDNIRAGSSNASDDGYKITHSLRWDKGSNAYLYRTCGTPTNQTKISFFGVQGNGKERENILTLMPLN